MRPAVSYLNSRLIKPVAHVKNHLLQIMCSILAEVGVLEEYQQNKNDPK